MFKSQINEDMVDGFNDLLEDLNSIVRLKQDEDHKRVYVALKEDSLISSSIVNLSDEFYSLLEGFFKNNCNVSELSYNNTRTTFWSYGD